jgi:hypothetical protein
VFRDDTPSGSRREPILSPADERARRLLVQELSRTPDRATDLMAGIHELEAPLREAIAGFDMELAIEEGRPFSARLVRLHEGRAAAVAELLLVYEPVFRRRLLSAQHPDPSGEGLSASFLSTKNRHRMPNDRFKALAAEHTALCLEAYATEEVIMLARHGSGTRYTWDVLVGLAYLAQHKFALAAGVA